MASIPFLKATACGNDFLIIDFAHAPENIGAFTRRICDRHNGVGADGVEWVLPASDADLGIRLLNADGSEAEISGNGTRCVAAWWCDEHHRDAVRDSHRRRAEALRTEIPRRSQLRVSQLDGQARGRRRRLRSNCACGKSRAHWSRWAIHTSWRSCRSSKTDGRPRPSRFRCTTISRTG